MTEGNIKLISLRPRLEKILCGVATGLKKVSYRTRKGAKFSDTTVDRLIRDPTAKGWRRANYTKSLGEKKHWKTKPEDEWVWVPVEPIIPEELWHRCNAFLDDQRRKRKRHARKPVHLFTGLAYCSCGQKIYVPSNTPKYVCYKCRSKIPIEDLEGVFQEQLKSFFFSTDEVAQYLRQADDVIKDKGGTPQYPREGESGRRAEDEAGLSSLCER